MSENETTLDVKPEPEKDQALVPVPVEQSILIPDERSVEAFAAYQQLQAKLDEVLKDCTCKIKGKLYRKKSYWRAVAMSFKLSVDLVGEHQMTAPNNEKDWGWIATYCARAINGQYAIGDGACFSSEKRGNDTVHNVRSAAHTRAYNRAVSNLVGFGEVSAEEFGHEPSGPSRATRPTQAVAPSSVEGPPFDGARAKSEGITQPQLMKIKATGVPLAKSAGQEPKNYFQGLYNELELVGVHSAKDLTKDEASRVIEKLDEIRGGQ